MFKENSYGVFETEVYNQKIEGLDIDLDQLINFTKRPKNIILKEKTMGFQNNTLLSENIIIEDLKSLKNPLNTQKRVNNSKKQISNKKNKRIIQKKKRVKN